MVSSAANLCSRPSHQQPGHGSRGGGMEPTAKRYALVGTGSRAEMFERAIARDHAATSSLVALCDTNPVRVKAHQRTLAELGAPPVAGYDAADFTEMLAKERVDAVIVTTMD